MVPSASASTVRIVGQLPAADGLDDSEVRECNDARL